MIVEGYAQQGTRDEQYLRSRARASIVRDYLIGKFHLDPQATGAMPLSADSTTARERPRGTAWPSRSSFRRPRSSRANKNALQNEVFDFATCPNHAIPLVPA